MTDTDKKDPFDIEPNEDGTYTIEVDEEVIAHLENNRIDPNETYDDILRRAMDALDKEKGISTATR
jgi:hypothetical protein